MTMHVRDEADVIGAQLAYHLAAGVDFVIAIDHNSSDETTAILEAYASAGRLHLIRAEDDVMRAAEWRSAMAKLAIVEYGADWVFSADADEFWWPHGGTLKDVLSVVPERWGVVHAVSRHFAPRPHDDDHFAERMIARVSPYSEWTRPEDPYHLWVKVAHRARHDLGAHFGPHTVSGGDLLTLRGWYPIEVHPLPAPEPRAEPAKVPCAQQWRASLRRDFGPTEQLEVMSRPTGWRRAMRSMSSPTSTRRGPGRPGSPTRDTRLRDSLRRLAGVPFSLTTRACSFRRAPPSAVSSSQRSTSPRARSSGTTFNRS